MPFHNNFYSTFECPNLLFAHPFIVNYPQYAHKAHMQFIRLQKHISIDLRSYLRLHCGSTAKWTQFGNNC